MKKIVLATIASVALLSGCTAKKNEQSISVGATPEPHATILNLIVDDLAKEGFALKVVEFTDYVTPNKAVEDGEIDANYFQHKPYMDTFNSEHGYHLVAVAGVHVEPIALYSQKFNSLETIPDGASIAIPNDATNGGRALLLLEAAGLIALDKNAGITAVPSDIVENKKNLRFHEIEAASLPRVLPDVDAAVINANYALQANLSSKRDGLVVEGNESPYVNVLTVKAGNENLPKIKALVKALNSDKVRNFINEKYPEGEVIAIF